MSLRTFLPTEKETRKSLINKRKQRTYVPEVPERFKVSNVVIIFDYATNHQFKSSIKRIDI